jgi:hypothetical protein
MADFLSFASVFCLLLSFVTQSEAVTKASQQVDIKDATFRLAKSSSFVEEHFSSESSGRGRERRDANSCAGSGRDTSPEYEIYNLKHGQTLENHDNLKPVWVNDNLIIITEDKLNGSHLQRVFWDSEGNINYEAHTNDIGGQRASAESITVSAADERTVFIVSRDQTKLFVSRDAGQSWTTYPLPSSRFNQRYGLFYHPSRAAYLMMLSGEGYLRVSRDYGKTWVIAATNVVNADWDADYDAKNVSNIYYMKKDGTNDYYSHTLYRCDDMFRNKKEIDKHVFKFVVDGRYLFWTKQNKSDTRNFTRRMYSSAYSGEKMHQVHIPAIKPADSYVVMGSHEAGAFIHLKIRPGPFKCSNNGSLHTSDGAASFFSLSLKNHLYYSCYLVYHDFIEIRSTPGVYVTSVVTKQGLESRISFDKGGSWEGLNFQGTIPEGACPNSPCQLHLHSVASQFAHATSGISIQKPLHPTTAPGLIVALGMFQPVPVSTVLGTKVQVRLDLTYLVISSDGGRKWTIPEGVTDPGNYYFTILDYGNAILIVQGRVLNPKMWISHNRGASFKCIVIDSQSFLVHGFVPVRDPSDQRAAIFGQNNPNVTTSGTVHWKVALINVTPYLQRPCLQSDYIVTTIQKSCILGQTLKFNLTKSSSQCYNTKSYSPNPVSRTPCECDESTDFECYYGWEREENGSCVEMNLSSSLSISNLCRPGSLKYSRPSKLVQLEFCPTYPLFQLCVHFFLLMFILFVYFVAVFCGYV